MNTEVAKGMIRQYEKDGDERWLEQAVAELGFEHDAPVIPEPDFERFMNWIHMEHDNHDFPHGLQSTQEERWDLKKTECGFVMSFDMVLYELQEVIDELNACGFIVSSFESEDMMKTPAGEFWIQAKPARDVL